MKRFKFESKVFPVLNLVDSKLDLNVKVHALGFKNKHQKELSEVLYVFMF